MDHGCGGYKEMSDMPPPFSFEICSRCGHPKDILEAIYLGYCEFCEIDIYLEKKRPDLYDKLGLVLQ